MRSLRSFASAMSPALVLAALLSHASPARAQSRGFALDRFDPSERGSSWFVLDSLDLRGHGRPAIGVVGSWGYKPLVVYDRGGGGSRSALVEHQVVVHPGASVVFWERVRGAFDLPIAAYQTGDDVVRNGVLTRAPRPSLGDLRLAADVRVLGQHGEALTLSLGTALYLPTGSRDEYTSDANVRLAPRAQVAGDVSIFAYAGRLGFNYRALTSTYDTDPLGSELTIAASAGIRPIENLLIGPEIFGSTVANAAFERRTTPLDWLFGAHFTHGELRAGAGIGSGLTRGWGTPVFRTVVSLEYVPSADHDTDGDGVMDSEDACPTQPGVRTTNPRTNGCPPPPPPPPSDRDGDAILDRDDACIDVPGVANPDPMKHGCPSDRDGDGVSDSGDACPDVPGVKSDDPKKNGCPPDKDGDGIYDQDDACPDVPGVRSDDPRTNGCPPDRDGDGILDPVDACPDAPGPASSDPKRNGCPEARIEDGQIKILQQVKFKTNSAEILADSDVTLSAVKTIIEEHPEIARVRIEGHTDNVGNPKYNKQLSEKRAASVKAWLVSKGIDKKRLDAKGFGLERPIDTNATDEGRTENRRVELHIEMAPDATRAGAGTESPPAKPK